MQIFSKGAAAAIVAGIITMSAGQAHAVPFSLSVDPTPDVTITTATPYVFSFTIPGFSQATDTVDDALLSVVLSDSGGSEGIRYNIEGNIYNQNNTGNSAATYTFNLGTLSILSTLADGILDVTVSATSGSFFFNSATLAGNYTRTIVTPPPPPPSVPEPATLALLGVGLLGAGFARRRKTV